MNEARPCCKRAAPEGYIYAIGGVCLSSVGRYDPQEIKWSWDNTFAVLATDNFMFLEGLLSTCFCVIAPQQTAGGQVC